MKADVVEVIESCYRPFASDDAWLEALLEAVQPVLNVGLGVQGMFFDVSDPATPRAWAPRRCTIGAPRGWDERDWHARTRDGMLGMFDAMPPPLLERIYRCPKPGLTASQAVGRAAWLARPERANWTIPLGVLDYIRVVCTDVTHRGCVLFASLDRVTTVPRRQTVLLRRLAVHAATGLRLRRQRAAAAPAVAVRSDAPGGEAILHADGRIAHAEPAAKSGAARAALRTFAKSVDRARSKLRRSDPDEATRLWEGLAAGRWSLVDHFDSDGRRYLVAHKNDPELVAPKALTVTERQVAAYVAMGHTNKLIGYELGLAPSTVATHLASAMLKLGVRSRADVARWLGGLLGRHHDP